MIRQDSQSLTERINSSLMPASVVRLLKDYGIDTVGALMDTDAYKAVTSGRYDLELVREINGIPISAFGWLAM